MFDFQRHRKNHSEVDFESSRSPAANLNLGKNQIDNAEPCFPHDNIAGSHLCAILPVVCHMPESILWLLLQVCWPTTECLVFRFVPNTSISIQFVSKLLTILQMIQFLPVWIDDHPSKDSKLYFVAPLSYLPARNIVQRTFEHVLPCRRTMPPSLHEAFPTLVNFQLLQQKYVIQTSLYIPQLWFFWFAFTLSTSQIYAVKKWCWFFQIHIFHPFLPRGSHFLLLSSHFDVIHVCR